MRTYIAHALARGYTDLYYVNMDTDELIEFHTDDERGVLTEARRGTDFFEGCERDAKLYIHPEDQAAFVKAMNRRFLMEALDGNKVYELTYRRLINGTPIYVLMKVAYLREACGIICDIFKYSPVFRVGGDEFAVVSQGKDYASIEELVGKVRDHNAAAAHTGGVVIACGMAKFEDDPCVAAMFERADRHMYENKRELKAEKQE